MIFKKCREKIYHMIRNAVYDALRMNEAKGRKISAGDIMLVDKDDLRICISNIPRGADAIYFEKLMKTVISEFERQTGNREVCFQWELNSKKNPPDSNEEDKKN